MRRFALHILVLTALAVVTIVGFILNVNSIAAFVGAFAGACTDPLLVLIALAIGAQSRSPLMLVLASIVAGVVFSLIIANMNASLGAELTVRTTFIRTCAILTLALVANVVRLLVVKEKGGEA